MNTGFLLAAIAALATLAVHVVAGGAATLCLVIVVLNRQKPWHMPQWFFFAIVTGLGMAGLDS